MPSRLTGQTLLLDADDTLWENNIYFERAIAKFIDYFDHQHHTPAQVRSVLNRCEHETIAKHGYGMRSFERSLIACFAELSTAPPSSEQTEQIARFAQSIAEEATVLLPGVAEVMPVLGKRHRLILVTKGNREEQQLKIERSGLHAHFTAVEIAAEKHEHAYREIIARYQLQPATTWMIGNSPRSDINPALAAGLHAVYVHHPSTWVLEQDAITAPEPPQRLVQLECFSALADLF